MKLIVGLGNPGNRYERTRHNAGFMLIDKLTGKFQTSLREGKGDYLIAETNANGERVFLMKPTAYMNNSGLAVRDVVQFYKIPFEDLLIVCDDAALPLGKIRLRADGSDGGQNGLKSVIYQLNSEAIPRLRIGVDHPLRVKMDLADFVLSRFTDEEEPVLRQILERSMEAAETFIRSGITKTMNLFNGLTIQAEPN